MSAAAKRQATTRGKHVLNTSVRLDQNQMARLAAEARRRDVGRNYLLQKAVIEWLERHEGEELP